MDAMFQKPFSGFCKWTIPMSIDGIRPANTMVDGAGQPGIGYFAILAA